MPPSTKHQIKEHIRTLIMRYEADLTKLTNNQPRTPVDFAQRHLAPGFVSALLVHPRNHDSLIWGIVQTHLNLTLEVVYDTNILINSSFREPHEIVEHSVTFQSRYDLQMPSGVVPTKEQLIAIKTAAQHILTLPISVSGNIASNSEHIVNLFEIFHTHAPRLVLLELSLIKSDLSSYQISDLPELLDSYLSLAQKYEVPIILVIKFDKPLAEVHLNSASRSKHHRTIARVHRQAIPPSHKIQGPPVNSLTPLSYASSEKGAVPLTY